MHRISMLGTGLIGMFYTMSLHSHRRRDRVHCIYSRSAERVKKFAGEWDIPRHTTDMHEAINDPETDVVVVALPNHLHEEAVLAAAAAGKAVLVTKPLGRNAAESLRMLEACEKAGVFHGYLEDLCYTPKTLKALDSVQKGMLGKILWVRSRETHSGPHSDWFWNKEYSGGGAIIDLGCHCIEIARGFIGKDIRPVEVSCWADTQVHPIEAEDHAIGLVRYENGAIGQFEVSWCFRGGMDLRDEVAGTEGTVWLNHWLRTGFEMFTATGQQGYVAEKTDSNTGWLFPVGDECNELGYDHMFTDMLDAIDSGAPRETLYDGYVVNAIIDACFASIESKKWEPVKLDDWRGREGVANVANLRDYDADHVLVKEEPCPTAASSTSSATNKPAKSANAPADNDPFLTLPQSRGTILDMQSCLATFRDQIADLCRRYSVRRLEIFGSATTDEFDAQNSDVDFLVEFGSLAEGQHADAYFGLLSDLQTLLGRPVDLVMTSAVRNQYFLEAIKSTRTLVYAA